MLIPFYDKFPHHYGIEPEVFLPGVGGNTLYFPGGVKNAGRDGVLIKVKPQSTAPWIGMFAFGDFGVTEIYTCPNADELLVLSRGAGYLINAESAKECPFPDTFIKYAQAFEQIGIILLVDCDEIYALSANGIVWKHTLGSGIAIIQVNDTIVNGTFERFGEPQSFWLDVKSGGLL